MRDDLIWLFGDIGTTVLIVVLMPVTLVLLLYDWIADNIGRKDK